MTHDAERWALLRRDREAGVIGGPDDGAGVSHPSLTTWEVHVSCDHGELMFSPEIDGFIDLLAAMSALAVRHAQEFGCSCIATDMGMARRALHAWRHEYGTDPVIPLGRFAR